MIFFEEAEGAKNFQDLLNKGFSSATSNYCDNFFVFVPTFSNKELTIEQAHASRRSFYDLLDIAKTYFPNTTEEELAHFLIYKFEHSFARYCHNIDRVVFYRRDGGIWNDESDREPSDKEDPTGISFDKIKKMADDVQNRIECASRPGWNSF